MVGVVLSIGDDDVIHEEDAHYVAGPFDVPGQFVIGFAGGEIA